MSYIDETNISLLVLAYPELTIKDRNWIDNFRKKHDPLFYGIVDPHFTIVFPTFGIEQNDFVAEVEEKSKKIHKFDFTIRCALMNNDRLSDYYYIFLSPDEGNSNIVKMHDILYSGKLRKTLRLDIDFFSHIAIGSTKDEDKCKELIDYVNNSDITINGSINSLNIISYGDKKIENIKEIRLCY